MTSTIIKTDGTRHDVVPRNKTDFQCDELQEIVGGYFEILPLSKSQIMVVNEEGKIHGKPYNHLATLCAYMAGIRDVIVGNVLVCDINMVK
jgi:hypothetical protein